MAALLVAAVRVREGEGEGDRAREARENNSDQCFAHTSRAQVEVFS